MDLSTEYLGMTLPHPLVAGAGPLADDLDGVKRLEDAGAAAIVLRSLFEEQITREQMSEYINLDSHGESFAEAASYFPSPHAFALGPFEYLEHLRRAKEAVRIPVMASLNGATPGGWIEYARLMAQAGADALELNLYRIATDPATTSADIERQAIDTVREVKQAVTIPVAVKLSPFYTAFAHLAAGARPGWCGWVGLLQPLLPTRHRRGGIDRHTHAAPLGFLGIAPSPALDGDPLGARPGVAGRHRRRAHRARRRQGHDGRCARHADGVGTPDARAWASPNGAGRPRGVDAGARVALAHRDAGQHEPLQGSRP